MAPLGNTKEDKYYRNDSPVGRVVWLAFADPEVERHRSRLPEERREPNSRGWLTEVLST